VQLKRVIVSDGEMLAMEPSLGGAQCVVFGDSGSAVGCGPGKAYGTCDQAE
jgi:hypothetical protein